MVRIKFVNLVISPVYGNCAPGDIVACDEAFARHCVEDLRCAAYLAAPAAPPPAPPAEVAAPPQPESKARNSAPKTKAKG
jgi:hypothetical protein